MLSLIIKGFSLGLSSSLFCLSSCGVILIALLGSGYNSFAKKAALLVNFLIGRFIVYVFLGVLTGWAGKKVSLFYPIANRIFLWLILFLSIILLFYAFYPQGIKCKNKVYLQLASNSKFFFGLGLLLGLNLCPPFWLAIVYCLNLADSIKSLYFFMSFFLGGNLFVLVILLFLPLTKRKFFNNFCRFTTAIIAGVMFFYSLRAIF